MQLPSWNGVGRSSNSNGWGRRGANWPEPRLRGALLAFAPLGLLHRHERRVDLAPHDLAVDHALRDVLAGGQLVHRVEQDLLHDRSEPSGTGATEDRLVGDRVEGLVGELQLDAV